MKKGLFLGIVFLCFISVSFSQTYSEGSFPDGQYKSMDDFLNRKPTSNISCMVYFPEGAEDNPIPPNQLENHVVFRQESDLKKMREYFAIVQNGNVYINQWWIFNLEEDKKDKRSPRNSGNFIRVLKFGKFMYLEGHFNSLKTRGYIVGHDEDEEKEKNDAEGTSHATRTFCIVFDIPKKDFDVFRNCEDFNHFLQTHNYNNYIRCDQKEFTLKNVRNIINSIFQL